MPPRPRGRRWRGPAPGLWGRSALAAAGVVIVCLILRDPISDLVDGLVGKMAFTEKAEEIDVNQLALEIGPADAPLEFGSRDDPSSDEVGPVEALQRILAELGFDAGVPDGVFGAGTETAVRNFQQSQIGLTADGRADEVTINVLLRVFTGRDLSRVGVPATPDDSVVPDDAIDLSPDGSEVPAGGSQDESVTDETVPVEVAPDDTVPAGSPDGGVLPGEEFIPPPDDVPFD